MNKPIFKTSLLLTPAVSLLCLTGLACHSHHRHHDETVVERPVVIDSGPEVFYDESGGVIEDPVLLERVRYYNEYPDEIVTRDGGYYFRGQRVSDAREVRAMELARLHAQNRQVKDRRYEADRAEKQKREELDRAEKQKREEYDRAEKAKRRRDE